MKATRSSQGALWEVACPVCHEPQTLPDGEHTFDCEATPNCDGELTAPPYDAEDYNEGEEVTY